MIAEDFHQGGNEAAGGRREGLRVTTKLMTQLMSFVFGIISSSTEINLFRFSFLSLPRRVVHWDFFRQVFKAALKTQAQFRLN